MDHVEDLALMEFMDVDLELFKCFEVDLRAEASHSYRSRELEKKLILIGLFVNKRVSCT